MTYPYRSILIPIEFDDPSLVAVDLAKKSQKGRKKTVEGCG
jgi:hypothetical protein